MSYFFTELTIERCADVKRRIEKDILGEFIPLTAEVAVTPEPVPFAKRKDLAYKPIKEGELWGKKWDCGWFHLKGRIPKKWAGEYVVARIDLSGELLVYSARGETLQGLTNGSVFSPGYTKDLLHITPECSGGEVINLWVDAAASKLFGLERSMEPDWFEDKDELHGRSNAIVTAIRICKFDYDLWQLWLDISVLENLMIILPSEGVRKHQIARCLDKAMSEYNVKGAKAAREILKKAFELKSDPASIEVTGIGHAHIDTAWLWPVRETIRKCGRTFSSQIKLLEKYPDYVFGASQAQLYAFTKEHYPKLYDQIKEAVKAGRWEVQGGMWVEADCNLISGESMIRQLSHGMNFFRDEFGVTVKNLWLPDVFGYSGNLPQILKGSGINYFLTQKLSWNTYNKFPHNTFIWKGIDDSDVLAHFPPEDTYNSELNPSALRMSESNNKERGLVGEAVSLFGIGNGGGGPKEEHIERGLRMYDLNGIPRFKFGHIQPVLEKLATYTEELSTWCGELYFETHRGTLTTQAAVKRLNRRAEEALRAAEMICACGKLSEYPGAELDNLWKEVLINQFHDIIPGSSIKRVYDETVPQLQNVVDSAGAFVQKFGKKMLKKNKDALTVFNPSTEDIETIIELPKGWTGICDDEGNIASAQIEGGNAFAKIKISGQNFATFTKAKGAEKVVQEDANKKRKFVLENEHVSYEFNAQFQLIKGFDKKAGVEFINGEEPGNRLEIFVDHGYVGRDAWDIEKHYRRQLADTARVTAIESISGSMRSGFSVMYTIGEKSAIRQFIWLESDSKRLDFVTEVDWYETHRLLRVAFPTTIKSDTATSEIQYGFVKRSTTDNTTWDYAQFECAAHRFVDLSHMEYGVTLLNDSKYGYRAKGQALELSLLRSPTDPDPVADKGLQKFTYAILPHTGSLICSNVRAHAAVLNQGVEIFYGFESAGKTLPVSVKSAEGIDLAVVKKADKENCIVARVVETRGLPSKGKLISTNRNSRIVPTNLVEWVDDEKGQTTGCADLALKPFEIKAFKVYL
jgi:alpha-mannosidase